MNEFIVMISDFNQNALSTEIIKQIPFEAFDNGKIDNLIDNTIVNLNGYFQLLNDNPQFLRKQGEILDLINIKQNKKNAKTQNFIAREVISKSNILKKEIIDSFSKNDKLDFSNICTKKNFNKKVEKITSRTIKMIRSLEMKTIGLHLSGNNQKEKLFHIYNIHLEPFFTFMVSNAALSQQTPTLTEEEMKKLYSNLAISLLKYYNKVCTITQKRLNEFLIVNITNQINGSVLN